MAYRLPLGILGSVLAIGLMMQFNQSALSMRIRELQTLMNSKPDAASPLDHIHLILRYNIHLQLYEKKITQGYADLAEFNLGVSHLSTREPRSSTPLTIGEKVVMSGINGIRLITGKKPINFENDDELFKHLGIAHYLERNGFYSRALEIFSSLLRTHPENPDIRAGILLHTGFCNAMLENHETARRYYGKVIREYGDRDIAITAAILLKFLDGFYREYLRIVSSTDAVAVKGEKMYSLFAYRKAINFFTMVVVRGPKWDRERALYYLGRCHEQTGRKDLALARYLDLLKNTQFNEYAKLALRRLFAISSFFVESATIKAMVRKINKEMKDPVLEAILNRPESRVLEKIHGFNTSSRLAGFARGPADGKPPLSILAAIEKNLGSSKNTTLPATSLLYRINTYDGNVFIGRVLSESNGQILLETGQGRIVIYTNDIAEITKKRPEP